MSFDLWPLAFGHQNLLSCTLGQNKEFCVILLAGKQRYLIISGYCCSSLSVSPFRLAGRDVPRHDGHVGSVGSALGALSPDDPVGIRGQLRGLCVPAAHWLHLPDFGLALRLLHLWWGGKRTQIPTQSTYQSKRNHLTVTCWVALTETILDCSPSCAVKGFLRVSQAVSAASGLCFGLL